MVSVIMASYNYGSYIGDAIESVIKQTFADWELIIFDDGSTDGSQNIISEYCKKYPYKIKFFTHPQNINLGLMATLVESFKLIHGKYTAFLESDDKWHPDCLNLKIAELKKFPEASLVFSAIEPIYELAGTDSKHIDYLKYSKYIGNKAASKPYDMLPVLWLRNPAVTFSNIIIRSEILTEIELLKEFELWSDWRILFHASLAGDFVYVGKPLVYWRVHSGSANYKYMRDVDPRAMAKRFLESTELFIVNYLSERNRKDKLKKMQRGRSFPFAQFFRLLHDLGFALYSPGSVIRELLRMLK